MNILVPEKAPTEAFVAARDKQLEPLRAAAVARHGLGNSSFEAKGRSAKDLAAEFTDLGLRASIMYPGAEGDGLKKYFDEMADAIQSEVAMKKRGEMILAAREGDEEKIRLRAELLRKMYTNVIRAKSSWAAFFTYVPLKVGQIPVYEVATGQEILVEAIDVNGFPKMVQASYDKKQYPIPLEMYWTQWVEYPMRDLYKGTRTKDLALSQIDLAYDWMNFVEGLLSTYIIVGGSSSRLTAAFDTTNADLKLRDYVIHGRINAANLPAGNLVTLTTNTNSTVFRKEVLDTALAYAEAWGTGLDGVGPLELVSIRVASADVGAWRGQITLTSESNHLTEQIMQGGAVINYAGKRFVLIGDETLDPNDGMAYCQFNQPIGEHYEVTEFADTIVDESPERVRAGKGRMSMGSALGFAMPRPLRKNILGVRYRTPT